MSEWQPIETAPREGTIMLYDPRRGMSFGCWYLDEWATLPGLHRRSPTHWMPLPEPPK